MFGSIFNINHDTTILCCTTTDLGIFYVKYGFYGTLLWILGVAFVSALRSTSADDATLLHYQAN